MKSRIPESLILALAVVAFGILVYLGIEKASDRGRVVHVRGLAEMEVPADKVFWNLSYGFVGNDMQDLFKTIDQKNITVKHFLTDNGISVNDITFNPPSLSDHEANAYTTNHSRYRYSINSSIIVATTDVDAVRELRQSFQQKMSNLIDSGLVLNSGYASYEFTGLNKIKPQMIEEATINARAVAEKFAKDSQSKLGKIRNASQGVFSIDDRDENTPYIKKVRVVTTIDFALED